MNLNFVAIIVKKELKDMLRDKRTIFISIIMPILLFPLIFTAMDKNIKRATNKISKNLSISTVGESRLIKSFLEKNNNINVIISKDPQEALDSGDIYAIIFFPDNCDSRLLSNSQIKITIMIDNTRNSSIISFDMLSDLLNIFHDKLAENKKLTNNTGLLLITQTTLEPKTSGNSKLILSILLPLLLLVFSATSPMAVATDLGAGEKERCTLEPLLATPPARLDLLLGKLLAITVIGLLGVIAFNTGIIVSFITNPDFFGTNGLLLTFSARSITVIIIFTLLLILLFGSIELSLSVFARSPKEAQVLFIPLLMISLACGYGTTFIDPKNIDTIFWHIPLINISLLIKTLSLNIISAREIVITLSWTIIYITASFILSLKIFVSEKVLLRSR